VRRADASSRAGISVQIMTKPRVVPLTVAETAIAGLFVVTMKQVEDERGVVREFYRESAWQEVGLPSLGPFVQINITESKRGAVRGLHGEAMNKVVAVAAGEAFGAYVDARQGSATYGMVATVPLVAGQQVVVPRGVCNGFQTLSAASQYLYCFDAEWRPGMAGVAVNPTDPSLGIEWPLPPVLSDKDASAPAFRPPW
jgi:dTDP-4-dehydrorhamnose 3,5-epimerase